MFGLRDCRSQRHWNVYFFASAVLYLTCIIQGIRSEGCTLRVDDTDERRLLKRLEPLKGKVFTVSETDSEGKKKYNYSVGICAIVGDKKTMAGAVQQHLNESYILGLINSTDVMGGDVWISLQYSGGHTYSKHCSQQPRHTSIMIICDESADTEKLNFVEERKKQTDDLLCFYLFELNTKSICPEKKAKLSTGSVICLIVIPCCCIYLLLGFLYRRVVVGAKGLEQIPNYAFWQDFGNLQADGCDFICRCGSRQQSQAYRGIDDCLDREEEERDDQLLTM